MNQSKVIKSDLKLLNLFARACSDDSVVKIGVLASKAARSKDKKAKLNNAEIGAIHELGLGVPVRSWLRMPLKERSRQIIAKTGYGNAAVLLLNGNKTLLLKRLGVAGEEAITEAFETRGFGKWEPNAASTVRRKSRDGRVSDMPLIDKTFLKRSVASKVDKPR